MCLILATVTFVCDVCVKTTWTGTGWEYMEQPTATLPTLTKISFKSQLLRFNNIDPSVTQALAYQIQCKSQYMML